MENQKVFTNAKLNPVLNRVFFALIFMVSFYDLFIIGKNIKYFVIDLIILVLFFIIFRRILDFKIITDATGISYSVLFKKFNTSWQEIVSFRQSFSFPSEIATVKTKKGNFSFPLEADTETSENAFFSN